MSNKITKNELHEDIVQTLDDVNVHKAEDAIHLAGGTANAITVTTPQGNYAYEQFKQLRFKAVADSTGNVTINVDGKGAVPALKFDGTQLPAGAIKANKVYDFYYDTANGGRFFLIAKASGNATANDVLAPKTFSSDEGEFVGAIPTQTGGTITPSTTNQVKPAGYYPTAITVTGESKLIPDNIRQGITLFNVAGNLQPKNIKSGRVLVNISGTTLTVPHNAGFTPSVAIAVVEGEIYKSEFRMGGTYLYARLINPTLYRNGSTSTVLNLKADVNGPDISMDTRDNFISITGVNTSTLTISIGGTNSRLTSSEGLDRAYVSYFLLA